MRILAIDSSAVSASVALTEDEKLISESYVNIGLTHSETLMPMVDSTLKNAGISINDVDAFCVTTGPGSFTGIRIGVSAVKGLALPFNKPCCGVSTLEAMAYCQNSFNGIICCTMDARCSQVYTALFLSENNTVKRITEDKAISTEQLFDLLKEYNQNILLCGDGADLCYNAYSERLTNVFLSNGNTKYQRAYGAAAAALINKKQFISADEINPVYIRPPQAERELKLKKGVTT